MNRSVVLSLLVSVFLAGLGFFIFKTQKPVIEIKPITNFEECVAAGNPITESYPRQCRHGDETFTEVIGNELEKADLIRIYSPRPGEAVSSPLTITGEARGSWFFEGSFPVYITNWDGLIIGKGIATAKSNWMTSEFVAYEAKLTFKGDKNAYSNKGTLILKKDNPSGLPEHDDALEISVVFAGVTGSTPPPVACTMEAKLCPDGSYVGRTGPRCEFSVCPTSGRPTTKSGTLTGTVTLGPTCPVERIPPDPACAPKPFQGTINALDTNSRIVATTKSDTSGNFTFQLSPGNYEIQASGSNPYPRCSPETVVIKAGTASAITISCDTGIR